MVTLTNVPISLFKKSYDSIAAAQGAATQGRIIFDKAHRVICVDGEVFGGGDVQDVKFENQTLKVWKLGDPAGSPSIQLDFSDVASAQGTMTVFAQLQGAIGAGNDMNVQGAYNTTAYLQGAQTLINADKVLDDKIKDIAGEVSTAQGAIETLQGAVNTNEDNITAAQGAIERIDTNTGLNGGTYSPAQGAWATQGATNMSDAIAKLDTAVQGVTETGKSYTMVQSAPSSDAYLKSYQLQQVVGGTITNVGVPIDIPKDYLVKSAEVKTVETADVPYEGAEVGDKYIDFVVNTKESLQAADEHIYLPVKDLVDAYTQGTTETIEVVIDNNNQITANLKSGSVQSHHLAANAVQTAALQDGSVTASKLAPGIVVNGADEVVVNGAQAAIATIAGQQITVQTAMYWTEWDTNE